MPNGGMMDRQDAGERDVMNMRENMGRVRRWSLGLLVALGLGSCAAKHPEPPPVQAPLPAPDVRARAALVPPVTFVGEMPCKACGGMRRTLTLLDDGSYRLRQQYESTHGGEGIVLHEIGRWRLEGRRLTLRSESGRTGDYYLADSTRLEQLGREGERLTGTMVYSLSRAARVDPIAESMRVTGIFNARSGTLVLCGTGEALPVLSESHEMAALQRAARESGSETGLWVSVQAEWVEAQRRGAAQRRQALRIEQLLSSRPGQSCPATHTPGPAA